MAKTELKIYANIPLYTDKKRRVIIGSAGKNRRFSLKQRCILPTLNDAGILRDLLEDYFPTQIFNKNENIDNLDILNYTHQIGGQWLLDLVAMSRSDNFDHLFHEDFPAIWNVTIEGLARQKYSRADVTRYFIDMENEKFFREFSKLKKANMVKIDKDAVSEMFLDKLGYYNGKSVWENWDYTKLVVHRPADVYKAFIRYAHKIYTLMGFGLFKLNNKNADAFADSPAAKLLLEGQKLHDKIVIKYFPAITRISPERLIAFFDLEQEILESVPAGGSKYAPTEAKVFIKQLKGRIPSFFKQKAFDNPDQVNRTELFNSSDRKSINKYMEKIGPYIEIGEDFSDYREVRLNGTYREKVAFLHRFIGRPSIRACFERELEKIYGLINKLSLPLSLDAPQSNDENEGSFIFYDILGDGKNVPPDERLSWADLFKDVFKQEFDEPQLEKFLKCVPGHFHQFPPEYDAAQNFKMSYYSKKNLFSVFCKEAGIGEDKELWEPFLELIQQIIKKINDVRHDIRSRQ